MRWSVSQDCRNESELRYARKKLKGLSWEEKRILDFKIEGAGQSGTCQVAACP